MSIIKRFAFGLALSLIALGALAEPIDINTATAEQIADTLVGIGKAKAEAIVQDREKNGPFHSADDLARVKGIKAATIAKNRDKIAAGAGTVTTPVPASPAKAGTPKAPAKSAS
jgi:competence protein ComEA